MQYNYAKDWSSAYFLKVLPGDEANAGGSSPNHNYRILMITQMYLYQTQVYLSVWNLYYRTIALANTIINKAEAGSNQQTICFS
jgi:hypothetical protein